MSNTLSGLTPADTFQGLIKIGNNTNVDGTAKVLSDGAGNDLPMEVSTTGVNFTGTVTQNGSPISTNPSGGAGAIQFSDGSAFASDSNLFWDNTNKRLGVGTNVPTSTIHAIGVDNTTARSVQIANQQGSGIFSVANDRVVQIGDYTASGYQSTLTFLRASGGSRSATFNQNNSDLILTNPNGGFVANGLQTTLKGSGSTSATSSLLVQNSIGTDLLKVTDDGNIRISSSGSPSIGYSNGSRNIIFNDAVSGIYSSGMGINAFGGFGVKSFDGSAYTLGLVLTGNGNQRVGIGSTLPNASAKLDVSSTTQGFLPPRMTTTEKNAISSPASGLIVYDSTTNKLCCYNGTSWNDLF